MTTPTELLYPKGLAEVFEDDTRDERDIAIVPRMLWTKWFRTQTTEVLLIEIKQRNASHILTVESHHGGDPNNIYIPQRCLNEFDKEEYVLVKVLQTMPPIATKITLQPLDNELYHCDISTAVGEYLSNWNVLKKHTTFTIPLKELGGFEVDIFVKDIEPAETVLLRGEVPLELEEPLESVQEWTSNRPPTPIPEINLPLLNPGFSEADEMLPSLQPILQPNQQQSVSVSSTHREPPSFVPFSGVGRRLCD